jgi:hypothetical protein
MSKDSNVSAPYVPEIKPETAWLSQVTCSGKKNDKRDTKELSDVLDTHQPNTVESEFSVPEGNRAMIES